MAEWLNTNPKAKLNKLDLGYCNISAHRAKALADILKTNKTITKVDLTRCGIGAEGAKEIVTSIVGNPNSKITALNLGVNAIGPDGVKVFIEPLKANATITTLGLGANYFAN